VTNTPGDPEDPWARPDPAPAGGPSPAAVTREVPITGGAAPTRETPLPAGADLPMLTRDLPASGTLRATSDRPGPWDAVVAPFTVPPTRHDNRSLPRGDRTPIPPGDPWGGPAPLPAAAPSGVPPAGGSAEGRSRTTVAFVAAGAAALVAAAVALAFGRLGGAPHSPTGTARTLSAAAVPHLRYRTVERDTGYFEGTVTLVNRGATPLRAWTLGFTYPGADIHNAWEVVLRRKGEHVVIVSAPGAAPIAPGGHFDVRFGGAGRPGMPTGCRLNGAPCAFTR
jgi:hypothetical protein